VTIESEFRQPLSRAEIMEKVRQLQGPCLLAARALSGLSLFLLGNSYPEPEMNEMLNCGKSFLEIFRKDWRRWKQEDDHIPWVQDEPAYQPSEVIPEDVRRLNDEDLEKVIVQIEGTITGIVGGGNVAKKDVENAINNLHKLGQGYGKATRRALSEYTANIITNV